MPREIFETDFLENEDSYGKDSFYVFDLVFHVESFPSVGIIFMFHLQVSRSNLFDVCPTLFPLLQKFGNFDCNRKNFVCLTIRGTKEHASSSTKLKNEHGVTTRRPLGSRVSFTSTYSAWSRSNECPDLVREQNGQIRANTAKS